MIFFQPKLAAITRLENMYFVGRIPKRHRKGKKQESEYVRETTESYIFVDDMAPNVEDYFDPRLLEQLQRFNIGDGDESQIVTLKHVLLMDIPALDVDGLITFQNTINRPFNLMDVRFAYGEMKRFGLEKSKANRVREKAYGESAGFFVHGINHAVSLSRALLNELGNQRQPAKARKISDDLKILMEWINNTVVNLSRLSNLNRSIEELHKTQKVHWNIVKEISQLCNSLSSIGNICKGTKVHFVQRVPSSLKNTYINKDAVLLVIFNMLENALKYSFCIQNKLEKLEDYNLDDETTRGHVHVDLSVDGNFYIFNIINWGCSIVKSPEEINSKKQNEDVRKFLKDNPISSEFIRGKNIPIWSTSSGKGIPTMDKYATLLDGIWNYTHEVSEGKTIFTLKIKHS